MAVRSDRTNPYSGEAATHGFFSELPATTSFMGVVSSEVFHPAPHDWIVVVADIRSSTQAVEEGRYKQVNMVGGCVVCAAINATLGCKIPFVFGGDGATLLIPADARRDVEAALVRTRTLAREDFDLELRVGFVPVAEVRTLGKDVLVARYEVSPGNNLAMFSGGGVELADKLIKEDAAAERYSVAEYSLSGRPDLTGLSCRWEPLRSQKGTIVCLLVRLRAEDLVQRRAVLAEVLSSLTTIVGTDLRQASPVTPESMQFRWPPKGLGAEARASRGEKSFLRRYLEVLVGSFIQLVLERFDLKGGAYDAPAYREELRNNSDYCRFDDVLRMVLDCTKQQSLEISQLLRARHEAGDIDSGMFEVEQALMTCLLFDLDDGHHPHFIDGDAGGFWRAALEFKQQRSRNS